MVVVLLDSVRTDAARDPIAELYAAYEERLRRIVRRRVRAPEVVIADACQVAWSRLLLHRDRIRTETALAWLATTAIREALRLLARQARELACEELSDGTGELALTTPTPALEELVAQRERLATLSALSERQQRLVWLQGFGLSYAEMADRTGATPRTVERQLVRAKRTLRSA
jgi:RNA polymerase sigma factor (sigma-70 family)